MIRPRLVDQSAVAWAIGALCLAILSACSTRGIVAPCDDIPPLLEAGTNIVLVPPRAPSFDAGAGSQVAEGLQLAAAASLAAYNDIKVVRLVKSPKRPAACEPATLEYQWSGCSSFLGNPLLISNEPVFLLWANLIPDGEEALFHFNASMWRVNANELVSLELKGLSGRTPYRFEALVPLRQVGFQPRALSLGTIRELAASLDVLSAPQVGASPVSRGIRGSFRVIGITGRGNDRWLNIELSESEVGWVSLSAAHSVRGLFPELLFLDIAVGYFEYMRSSGGDGSAIESALERFLSSADPKVERRAIGLAYAFAGTVELFEAARLQRRSLADLARRHYENALKYVPDDPELHNLLLLATLGSCCGSFEVRKGSAERSLKSVTPMNGSLKEILQATDLAINNFESAQTNARATSNLAAMLRYVEEAKILHNPDLHDLVRGLEEKANKWTKAESSVSACERKRPK